MVTTATRTWNDLTFGPGDPRTGNYFPDCDFKNQAVNGECQATNPSNFGSVNRRDDVMRTMCCMGSACGPYTWQGSVAVQHQVLPRQSGSDGRAISGRSYGNFR